MVKLRKGKIICSIIIVAIVGVSITGIFINREKKKQDNNPVLEGTISFVSNRTDKKNEIESLINEFEELHPNVKVDLELLGDPESILYRRAIVDELPDITLVPGEIKVSDYKDYFLPLEELGFTKDDIYNYYVGVGQDNVLYNLTTSINWNGVIYNKKVFEEAGISTMPTTAEEFLNVCQAIKDIGKVPIAINYKQSWAIKQWVDVIPNLLNPNLESEVIVDNKDILGEDSSLLSSLNLLRDIVQNNYCEDDLLNYEWETCKNDFINEDVAMFFGTSGFVQQLEDLGMDRDEIAMFPFMGSDKIYIFGEYRFAISKNSDNPEVAKEFLKFIFEEDRYSNAVNILSPLKDSDKDKEFFVELNSFNMPIEIYGESLIEYNEYYNKIHEEFESLKKLSSIDYTFAQLYSTVDNKDEIIEEINYKWKSAKLNNVSE